MVEESFAEKLRRRQASLRQSNVRPRGSEEALAAQQLARRQASEYAFQQRMLEQGLGVQRDLPPASGLARDDRRQFVSPVIASVPEIPAHRVAGSRARGASMLEAASVGAAAAARERELDRQRGVAELVRASRTSQLRAATPPRPSALPSLAALRDAVGEAAAALGAEDPRGPPPRGPDALPEVGDASGYARRVRISDETRGRRPFGGSGFDAENDDWHARQASPQMPWGRLGTRGETPFLDEAEKQDREVKGVSASPVALPGVFASGAGPTDFAVRFLGCGKLRDDDLQRLGAELALGIYAYGAVPWLSLESVCDRHASRLSTLHPCYRGTLVGRACLELDVALKAVGGTAHGGLFLDTAERDAFLKKECRGRDWGPNGQRELPEALRGTDANRLAGVEAAYPSFTTSEKIFGGHEVRDWKREWEAAWDGDATGADIKASLERLDVHEAYDETGRRLLFADAHTSWGVDIHASAGSARARDVARRGEDMCARLLPRVPCPRAPPGEWAPPGFGADYLAYLVALLRCAAVLSSALLAAKHDAPDVLPLDAIRLALRRPWPNAATPRWLPFEPALDNESGAPFLGGGVSVGVVKPGAVSWASQKPSADDALARTYVLKLDELVEDDAITVLDTLLAVRDSCAAPEACFLYEVSALGLRDNYATAHPSARLPRPRGGPPPPLDAGVLAAHLAELLPLGYCRRVGKGRVEIARAQLRRLDAAELLAAATGDTVQAAETKELKPVHEKVTLLNGDVHDGKWLFGRKHGSGVYAFASGAKFEGKWDMGKMVGIGWFTAADGTRNIVDLRKKKDGGA